MATLSQIATAIKNADAAGDTDAVNALMGLYREQQYLQAGVTPPVKTDSGDAGFFENIGTGLASGFVGTGESAALGVAAALEEEQELKAREKIQSVAANLKPEGGDKDSLTYKLASGVGSLGAFASTALLGKAALPAAGVLALGSGAGEASERARAYGATESERGAATLRGAAIGATELIPLGALANKLKLPNKKLANTLDKLSTKVSPATITGIKSRLQRAAATGGAEFAQEAAAAVLQNLNEQGYNPQQVLFDSGVLEEGMIGGGAGAILKGLIDAFGGKRKTTLIDDESKAEEVKEETTEDTQEKVEEEAKEEVEAAETVTPVEKPAKQERPAKAADIESVSATEEQLAVLVEYDEATASDELTKEAPKDDGKQATTAPIKETSGESVPSSVESVDGGQPSDTGGTGGTVEGGLDSRVDSARKPAGREGRKQPPLVEKVLGVIEEKGGTPAVIKQSLDFSKKQLQPDDFKALVAEVKRRYAPRKNAALAPRPATRSIEDLKVTTPKVRAYADTNKVNLFDVRGTGKGGAISIADVNRVMEKRTKEAQGVLETGRLSVRDDKTGKIFFENVGKGLQKLPVADNNVLTVVAENPDMLASTQKGKDKVKAAAQAKVVQQYFNEFLSPADAITAVANDVATPSERIRKKESKKRSSLEDKDYPEILNRIADDQTLIDLGLVTTTTKKTGKEFPTYKVVQEWLETNLTKNGMKAFEAEVAVAKEEVKKQESSEIRRVNKEDYEASQGKDKEGKAITRIGKKAKAKPKAKAEPKAKAKARKTAAQIAEEQFNSMLPKADLSNPNQYNKLETLAKDSVNVDKNTRKLQKLGEKSADARAENIAKVSKETAPDQDEGLQAAAEMAARQAELKNKAPSATATEKVFEKLKNKHKKLPDNVLYGAIQDARENTFPARASKDRKVAEYLETRTAKQLKEDYKDYINGREYANDVFDLRISRQDMESLVGVLPDSVVEMVNNGDLKGVLEHIAENSNGRDVSRFAKDMLEFIGDTKLTTATTKELGEVGGLIVGGQFNATTNTISLNTDIPITIHAVLHEVAHAVTVTNLKKKGNPYSKKLNNLFSEVKDSLGTAYGAENVYEFVAELWSNPTFRRDVARIRIKGERTSAWNRFVNIITNLFRTIQGKDSVAEGGVLSEADALITHLLAPTVESAGTESLSAAARPQEIYNLLSNIRGTEAYKGSTKPPGKKETLAGIFSEAGVKAKSIYYQLLGGQSLGDAARSIGFGNLVIDLDVAITEIRGLVKDNEVIIDKVLEKYRAWAKQNPKAKAALNRLVYSQEYGATIYQVDPTKLRSVYEGKTGRGNADLAKVWDDQQKEIKIMGKDGLDQFNAMRNAYKELYKDLKAATDTQIESLVGEENKDTANTLKQKLNERIFKEDALDVYFPLVRQGDYKLLFDAKVEDLEGNVTKEQVFLMFPSKAERDSFVETLEGDENVFQKSIETFKGDLIDVKRFESPPNGSFVAEVLDILKVKGVDDTISEEVLKLFIDRLPETSFAKSFLARKGTPGYIQEVEVAMADKGYTLASQVGKLVGSAKVRAVMRSIEKQAKQIKGDSSEQAKEMVKVASERANFALHGAKNKGAEKWYKNMNQAAFLYTIGGNLSSALVNLSQIPLVVVPMLSGRFGLQESIDAFTEATSLVSASNITLKEYYTQTGKGMEARFTVKEEVKEKIRKTAKNKQQADAKIKQLQDLEPLIIEASARGQLYTASFMDELGTDERAGNFDKITHLSAVAFNAAERFNRQTTLVTSYTLIRKQMAADAKSGKKYYSEALGKYIDPSSTDARAFAAKEAMYITQETNGGAVLETAPRLTQEGWMRVAGMYKSYGLQMYYTIFKTANTIAKNSFAKTPEGKERYRVARNQMIGVHLSAVFFAGLSGIPIYGAIRDLVDLFLLDDDEDDADTLVRKAIGEMWYKGIATEILGVDVASRIKLTDLILQQNRYNPSASWQEDTFFYLGGPFMSTLGRIPRAKRDFEGGFNEEAFDNLLPPAISNMRKGLRYAEEGGIRTRREDFIYEDISGTEVGAKMFGFTPSGYTFEQERNARNKRVEKAIVEERTELLRKLYVANRVGDWETANDILDEISEYNDDHPEMYLDADTVRKSMNTHAETSVKMYNGVTINDKLRSIIDQSNSEYKQ
jgi:pyruvate/2-oxoglutarate dehydrogenase complex dihydrolipoamide acyltransferase (E2) component